MKIRYRSILEATLNSPGATTPVTTGVQRSVAIDALRQGLEKVQGDRAISNPAIRRHVSLTKARNVDAANARRTGKVADDRTVAKPASRPSVTGRTPTGRSGPGRTPSGPIRLKGSTSGNSMSNPPSPRLRRPSELSGGTTKGSSMSNPPSPRLRPTPSKPSTSDQTFGQAFAAARKAGLKVFTWRGSSYNTKVK